MQLLADTLHSPNTNKNNYNNINNISTNININSNSNDWPSTRALGNQYGYYRAIPETKHQSQLRDLEMFQESGQKPIAMERVRTVPGHCAVPVPRT